MIYYDGYSYENLLPIVLIRFEVYGVNSGSKFLIARSQCTVLSSEKYSRVAVFFIKNCCKLIE